MKEFVVTIGYPLFLESQRYRGHAKSAKEAAEKAFFKASGDSPLEATEYTGPKKYDASVRAFTVYGRYRTPVAVFVEEIDDLFE